MLIQRLLCLISILAIVASVWYWIHKPPHPTPDWPEPDPAIQRQLERITGQD